ncbi:PstS family phosphate ABC transporter substrate-binding protein [Streptomyces griseorubiginosus]|uniref:PstS family phosphate ABC transporter substrate-binding protein n=1 Tax=Streptomyces griseorubiginosus TaxID=67304 RepID=UPI001AD7224F|nr:substrate-binding domain-containing protein [Streptomyces griseorubiginosus]MBO4256739.1 phosphate ABC transporter substrate-binding protein [Streptomyces griseorubiginosus]
MQWFSPENVVAVGTAVLGIAASGVMVWYERRVPRRKRIGYRVQMDNPIGDDVRLGRANVRLGLFDEAPGMSDATLVLIRVENDGSQGIDRDDYTSPEVHGLTAVFNDRTIRGVSVTQPSDTDHLMDHFTPTRGFGYEGNTLRIPRVPLNRGDHYKLLVLLSGGDVGSEIRLFGGIREGEVHPNRSATPDEKPPLFSRAARLITIMLTVSVLTLAVIVVARDDHPVPIGCEKGRLTVTGSTAFAPVVRDLAKDYQRKCPDSAITVDARGSSAGVNALSADSRSVVAFSDGPAIGGPGKLVGRRIALSVFTLVVNDGVRLPAKGLSVRDVRRIYRGEVTRWKQLDASLPDLPIVLVSRNADSGTRQIFQRRVLGTWERVPSTSLDCVHKDDTSAPVMRCELDSTEDVLATVARIPGALGYSEFTLASSGHPGLRTVPLDGAAPSVEDIEYGRSEYPYRGVEYAYTYGTPASGSLAAAFLAYIGDTANENVIRAHGHLPCSATVATGLCSGD